MNLSNDLISQFVKVTNDSDDTPKDKIVVYGAVVDDGDGQKYVKLDSSEELTPIDTTVEVNPGDRVTVTVQDHRATVTGNLSDPAVGRTVIEQTEDSILLQVKGIEESLSASIKLNQDSITTLVKNQDEFSQFQQTVEGFEFMGKGGEVKISGGNITLTGCISWEDLKKEVQKEVTDAQDAADAAQTSADNAQSTANSALSYAASITIPNYLKSTYISETTIKSPTIEGNNIGVYGTFQTYGSVISDDGTSDGSDPVVTGYMGAARGLDGNDNITYGVALSNEWNSSDLSVSNSYVIVTNAGVRLQFGQNRIVVSNKGIYLTTSNAGAKAYYNGIEIGTGSGSSENVTVVWG